VFSGPEGSLNTLLVVSRDMKRIAIILSILCVLVYGISWFFGTPYIHVLIGIIGIQLFLSLASVGENEEELAELKAQGSWVREWHIWVLLACILSGLVVAEYYYPVLESFGAK